MTTKTIYGTIKLLKGEMCLYIWSKGVLIMATKSFDKVVKLQKEKHFLIIGNMNAITYKKLFPLIKDNRMWLGLVFSRSFGDFIIPESYSFDWFRGEDR